MDFKQAVTQAMAELAKDERVIFLGQNVCYSGHVVYETLKAIPDERKLEVPVFENTQMGMATGLALAGYVVCSIYPRIDFLVCAMDQLINHLDKIGAMSGGQFQPHVIVRTMLGNTSPLHPGPQHSQDHSEALRLMLKYTRVWTPKTPEEVIDAYRLALAYGGPNLVVEAAYR